MGIALKTPLRKVSSFFDTVLDVLRDEITKALSSLGEECVRIARDRSEDESWYNRSGNLRSSIGNGVYAEGRKVMSSVFSQVLEGAEGSERGKRLIEELAAEYSKVYALAVVAAMPYADYVEAMENKVVLASAELWAGQQSAVYLKRAMKTAARRINSIKL